MPKWALTETATEWPGAGTVLIIAHRGAAGEAPENTLAAFELAIRQGADGIELDVHLSRDGVPVVIHDARLERTSSGTGRVRDHTANQLRRLDAGSWFNRQYPAKARTRYTGRKIPLLRETLEWVRERNSLAFIEVKPGAPACPDIEGKVLEEIYRTGVESLTTVISFRLATLRRVRALDSRIPLGLDFTRPLLALRRAKSVRARAVLAYWPLATPRFIRRAHQAGLQVFAWTVNQPAAMQRKMLHGVNGILTNYPARLAEVWARLAAASAGSNEARSG